MFHHLGEAYIVLRRRLKVLYRIVDRHLLSLCLRHLPIIGQVDLVAAEYYVGLGVGVFFDCLHPSCHSVEGLPISHIEGNDDSICLAIKVGGESTESLLTGSIPNLDADLGAI